MRKIKYNVDINTTNKIIKTIEQKGFCHLTNVFNIKKIKVIDRKLENNIKKIEKIIQTSPNTLPLCFADLETKNFKCPITFSNFDSSWYRGKNKNFKKWFWKNADKTPNTILNVLKKNKVINLLKKYFKSEIINPYSISVLRYVKSSSNNGFANIHQDMTYFTRKLSDHNFLTVWVPLTNCNKHSPGIKIYQEKVNKIYKTSLKEKHRCINRKIASSLQENKFYKSEIKRGDLIIFKSMMLHGTNSKKNMKKERRSAEFRFFPKTKLPTQLKKINDVKFKF